MTDRILTVSNLLSILRILLVVPVALLLRSELPRARVYAAGLIVLAALTDYLDGRIARMKGEVSRIGVVLDPIADKIGIGAVAVILMAEGSIPVWFAAAVLARDGAILAAAAILSRRGSGTPQSNPVGKWTAALLGLTLFVAVVDPVDASGLLVPAIGASAAMLLVSSAAYARRLFA